MQNELRPSGNRELRSKVRPIERSLRSAALCATLSALAFGGCGGKKQEAETPVLRQTARDEILRVGEQWQSVLPEKGLFSPPSPISVFENRRISTIRLSAEGASEELVLEEQISLRAGGSISCRTVFEHALSMRYGRKQGQAAVELTRPALSGPRSCDAPHPDGAISEAASRALFVLRADNLVAVEPPLEKRKYIPGSF